MWQATIARARRASPRGIAACRQRGFGGFFLVVLVAGMAAAAGLFTFYRTDEVQAHSDRANTDELAAAKAALVGYAVRRGGLTGTARPGELPCPDRDGDGEADTCLLARDLLGRLPWKTLGIPEPRDASGEALWYAIATPFRDMSSMPVGGSAVGKRINSDTRGTITVRGPDGTTVLTNEAIAVVFAPGAPLGAQNRGSSVLGTVMCTLTALATAPAFCATNYLDAALGTNNSGSTSGPFIAAARTDTFNDRLMYLTASDIMPAVEMRVGAELKALLQGYRAQSNCKCYPWADNWPYSGGIADTGQNRGRFPSLPEPEQWGQGAIPPLPAWIAANDWHNFFWYSVGRQNSYRDPNPNRRCRTCSDYPMLKVDDTWVSALLFAPGRPLDGIPRMNPPAGQLARRDNLALYLEDSENRDGTSAACPDVGELGSATPSAGNYKGALSCDAYVSPRAKSMNRDRLFVVGVAAPGQCAANARLLLEHVECQLTGNQVKPECQVAVNNLDACSCLAAAQTMLEPPCRSSDDPPSCQAAVAQLRTCDR